MSEDVASSQGEKLVAYLCKSERSCEALLHTLLRPGVSDCSSPVAWMKAGCTPWICSFVQPLRPFDQRHFLGRQLKSKKEKEAAAAVKSGVMRFFAAGRAS